MLMLITSTSLHSLLQKEPSIATVEVEGQVHVASYGGQAVTQYNPPWGLDRIDPRAGEPPLNREYLTSSCGDGVHVYVLDTVRGGRGMGKNSENWSGDYFVLERRGEEGIVCHSLYL